MPCTLRKGCCQSPAAAQLHSSPAPASGFLVNAALVAASARSLPLWTHTAPGGGVRGLPAAKMAVGKNKRMSKGKKGGKKKM
jgi:hypothetical protein